MVEHIFSTHHVVFPNQQCWKAQRSGRCWRFRAPLIWGKHRSIRSGIVRAWPLSIFLIGPSFGNRRSSCFVQSLGLGPLAGEDLGSFRSEPSKSFRRVCPIIPWTLLSCWALEFCLGRGGRDCWSTSVLSSDQKRLLALVLWKSCR